MNLPGGQVKQEPGDCFPACVSMLTGIDYDMFRGQEFGPMVHKSHKVEPGEYFHEPGPEFHVKPLGDMWDRWKALLADNGYTMKVVNERPNFPHVAVLSNPAVAHATVGLGDGLYVDPNVDEAPFVTDFPYLGPVKEVFYVTITLRETWYSKAASLLGVAVRNVLRRLAHG